ncbi:oligosaccharide flippase family protein [Patescibacteria group bacterium]|nr:oligosaccharide flippase family protein [Patescibacteria group bacterium]
MSKLVKWQSISLISKVLAISLGIIQNIIVLRILSPEEYGLVGIVLAIAGTVGIYQHLGLATGTVVALSREEDLDRASKVTFTSILTRLPVSLILAGTIIIFSDHLATNVYQQPSLSLPIKIIGLIFIIDGVKANLSSTLAGLQKFGYLFLLQVFQSAISLVLFSYLVKIAKVSGYFYALLLFNSVMLVIFGLINLRIYRNHLRLPTREEFISLFKEIFSLGIIVYFARILYNFWQKAPVLIMGLYISPEEIGYFSFASLLAIKIVSFSDAITDVTVPVLSRKFAENSKEFQKQFSRNFTQVSAFIFLASTTAIFFFKEITLTLIGSKYIPAFPLIPYLILAFANYSLINVVTGGVLIPTHRRKIMLAQYFLLVCASLFIIGFLVITDHGILGASQGLMVGSFLALIFGLFMIQRHFSVVTPTSMFFIAVMNLTPFFWIIFLSSLNFYSRLVVFLAFLLVYLFNLNYLGILKFEQLTKMVKSVIRKTY